MSDISKIPAVNVALPASGAVPALNLPANGQSIEARVAQILSNGLVQLASALGTVELQTTGATLQQGAAVSINVAKNGDVTITVPPQTQTAAQASAQGVNTPRNQAGTNVTQTPTALVTSPLSTTIKAIAVPAQPLAAGLVAAQQDAPKGLVAQPVTLQPINTPQPAAPVPASLANVLHDALSKQSSLAPLLANLDYASRHLRRNVPDQLRNAVDAVLKTLIPIAGVSSDSLENALHKSGVFQEATLAQLVQKGASADTPELQLDLKTALLKLESVLQSLAREPVASANTQKSAPLLHAPRHGEFIEAQPSQEPALTSRSTTSEIVNLLTQQTEAALSRLRVLQFASLPTSSSNDFDPQTRPAQSLHVDLPLMLPNQTAIIPLQIERDAERRDAAAHERRWRVRFAFNLAELGSIHALLAFGAGLVHVTLWAENTSTYNLFKANAGELRDALDSDELEIGGLEFRAGAPHDMTPPTGSYLDTRT